MFAPAILPELPLPELVADPFAPACWQPAGEDEDAIVAEIAQIGVDQVLAYGLDRYRAFDARIEGLVNDPHRALAKHAVDAVFAYGGGVSHGCPLVH